MIFSDDELFARAVSELAKRRGLPRERSGSSSRLQDIRWPDFLVAGVQKAGTTWLMENLDYHPEIWLPPIKEINYFNQVYIPSDSGWEADSRRDQSEAVESYFKSLVNPSWKMKSRWNALSACRTQKMDDKSYGSIFSHAGVDMVCGEISPAYANIPRLAISHIVSKNPSIKVFLVLRDPIDRTWSHMRMAYKAGNVFSTYEEMLSDEVWPTFFAHSNYPAMLSRWISAVPSENLKIFPFEMIAQKPEVILREFCETLGIYFNQDFFPKRKSKVGVGAESRIDGNAYNLLKERLFLVYEDLLDRFPEFSNSWYQRHYSNHKSNRGK